MVIIAQKIANGQHNVNKHLIRHKSQTSLGTQAFMNVFIKANQAISLVYVETTKITMLGFIKLRMKRTAQERLL